MTVRVNGKEIPEEAVRFELNQLVKFYSEHLSSEQVQEQMELLESKAREQAIGKRLLLDEAKKLDIRVPAADVQHRVSQMIEQAGGRGAFDTMLQRQGLTDEAIRDAVEVGLQVDALIEKITEGVSDPTEEEMQAHFEEHKGEYTRPRKAQVRHILIEAPSGREDREIVKSKLLEIRRRVEEGADFSDEAAAHSDCPSGRKSGGSLGWIRRGTMIPELDNLIFSMQVGEISDVVESPLGFHIFNKTAEEDEEEATFEDAREKVRDFLRHVRRGELIREHVEELKEKASIEED